MPRGGYTTNLGPVFKNRDCKQFVYFLQAGGVSSSSDAGAMFPAHK